MKYSSISRLLGGVETPRFFHFVENLIEISLKHISLLCYLGIFRYVNLSEVTSFCSSRHYAFFTVIYLNLVLMLNVVDLLFFVYFSKEAAYS